MTAPTPATAVLTGYQCAACRTNLVSDHIREELVCPKCGIVASEQHGSREMERGRPPRSAGDVRTGQRASGKTTLLRHDMGVSTDIAPVESDYSGNKISHEASAHMRGIRKLQKRMRASTPKDRRLAEMLRTIENMCEAASLVDSVRETAAMTYRAAAKRIDVKGRSTIGMAAASIHIACKKHGIVKGLAELCAGVCASDEEAARKSRLATRCYRDMVIETNGMQGEQAPFVPISKYISRTANMACVDARIERLALQLAEAAPGGAALSGKTPQGVAAAYLYIASTLLAYPMAQHDISAAAGIGDVTIRTRCRDILAQHRIRIVAKPVRQGGGAAAAAQGAAAWGRRRHGGGGGMGAAAAEDEADAAPAAPADPAAARQSRLFGF